MRIIAGEIVSENLDNGLFSSIQVTEIVCCTNESRIGVIVISSLFILRFEWSPTNVTFSSLLEGDLENKKIFNYYYSSYVFKLLISF